MSVSDLVFEIYDESRGRRKEVIRKAYRLRLVKRSLRGLDVFWSAKVSRKLAGILDEPGMMMSVVQVDGQTIGEAFVEVEVSFRPPETAGREVEARHERAHQAAMCS